MAPTAAQPPPTASLADRLAALSETERLAILAGLAPDELSALEYAWPVWARHDQLPPEGDWRVWLLLGGRGSGKTRSSSECIRAEVEAGRRTSIAIIGPTAEALRKVQIEASSGLLGTAAPWCRPSYEPSTRKIVWPNGAVAHLHSAEEPERLRGGNYDFAWWDEMCASSNAVAVYDMLSMALRVSGPKGDRSRMVISTTPKPMPLLKTIMAAKGTVITRARTQDNAANLDPHALQALFDRYDGTTTGRQELLAEILLDAEGALWSRALLDATRVSPGAEPDMRRIVISVDPAGGSSKTNDETGIIAVGLGRDGHCYVLQDISGRYSPDHWARLVSQSYHLHRADRVVAEQNFGGEMVSMTLRSVDRTLPVKMVRASRGKVVRAEPVAALFEQHRVHLVGNFPLLEDQLCEWEPLGNQPSPDRLDAMTWAITDLMLAEHARPAYWVNTIDFMGR